MKWIGHREHINDIRNAYKSLVGKPERIKPLGRSKHRWDDNIKMEFKEIGCGLDSSGSW